MMDRCFNATGFNFERYGARGITVCQFISNSPWSIVGLIGHRPQGKTLDRINNDGHYSCGHCDQCKQNSWRMNVRWATRSEQGLNRRTNHKLKINGEVKCVDEWAKLAGLGRQVVGQRLKRGWTGPDLLKPPVNSSSEITIGTETDSIKGWARKLGISDIAFAKRVRKWPKDFWLVGRQPPRQIVRGPCRTSQSLI
jgi:hypothetical protein